MKRMHKMKFEANRPTGQNVRPPVVRPMKKSSPGHMKHAKTKG